MKRWIAGGLCAVGLGTLVVLNLLTLIDLKNAQPDPSVPVFQAPPPRVEPARFDPDLVLAGLPVLPVAASAAGATSAADPSVTITPTSVGASAVVPLKGASPTGTITAPGPELAVSLEVADLDADGTLTFTRAKQAAADPVIVFPAKLTAGKADLTFTSSGKYDLSFTHANGVVDSLGWTLVIEPKDKSILAPIAIERLAETIGTDRYETAVSAGVPIPVGLAPTVKALDVMFPQAKGPVLLVDQAGKQVGEAAGTPSLVSLDLAKLAAGRSDLRVVDRWRPGDVARNPAAAVVVPKATVPPTPTVDDAATDKFQVPIALPATPEVIHVHGSYLQVSGTNGPIGRAPRFVSFVESVANTFVREPSDVPATLAATDGVRRWTADLAPPRLDPARRLFALSEEAGSHAYSKPVPYVTEAYSFSDKVAPPTIATVTLASGTALAPHTDAKTGKATYYTNQKTVAVTGSKPAAATSAVLRRQQGNAPPSIVPLTFSANSFTLADLKLGEGTNRITVSLVQGDRVGPTSDEVLIEVRGADQPPKVAAIRSPGFGAKPGTQTLTIRFDGGLMDEATVKAPANYTLNGSKGLGVAFDQAPAAPHPDNVQYDPATNTATLSFGSLPVDIYQLTIDAAKIKDVFGNPLTAEKPKRLGDAAEGAAAVGLDPEIPPAKDAPFVPYKEYTDPRDLTDGFNPSDKVETRVVRLYYYRDAHRVAQIVNRDLRSYNFAAVDTRRRLANEKRREADQKTDSRRVQESRAVLAAQATRAAEAQLAQAQQAADVAQRQSTQAPAAVARLNVQVQAAEVQEQQARDDVASARAAVAAATTQPQQDQAADDLQTAQADLAQKTAAAADLRVQRDDAQRLANNGLNALQPARDQINGLQAEVQRLRAAEGESAVEEIVDQQQEDRAREEQFRLEVAAAHEDPDHFAAGVPDSSDPVQQVSVSVIGEGLIQLRGPLKGINMIRIMINQIDAPAGQVRVAIHTVQVNGEKGKRMEVAVGKIKDDIDHSRFLTTQAAQMLRNAVVRVASRKADAVAQQCRLVPNLAERDLQATRDRMYIDAFFGRDFLLELEKIDSEFLMSGNKVLSLHSMDTTSLASAMFLMALAKTSVRAEIVAEFKGMMLTDLPEAEQTYYLAGGPQAKKHGGMHHKKDAEPLLACNARFESFLGYFRDIDTQDDTLSPIQREFIRLAQIFKSRLVTELELSQRVKERAIIEVRGDSEKELRAEQKQKEAAANAALAELQAELNEQRAQVFSAFAKLSERIGEIQERAGEATSQSSSLSHALEQSLEDVTKKLEGLAEWVEKKVGTVDAANIRKAVGTMKRLPPVSRSVPGTRIETDPRWSFYQARHARINEVRTSLTSAIAQNPALSLEQIQIESGTSGTELKSLFAALVEDVVIVRVDGQDFVFVFDKDGIMVEQPVAGQAKAVRAFQGWVEDAASMRDFFGNFYFKDINFRDIQDQDRSLSELRELVRTRQAPRKYDLIQLAIAFKAYSNALRLVRKDSQIIAGRFNTITADLSSEGVSVNKVFRDIQSLRRQVNGFVQGGLQTEANKIFNELDAGFQDALALDLRREIAKKRAEEARRPLDHKKLLDMLVDELEEKYIELLEGTRAHTANVDNYIKALATALDDDFNTQFYAPAFRRIRETGGTRDVQFAQIESTSILTNNRMFGKVEPQATMEFDLPKRDIAIVEAMNGAKAIMDDYGALVNDPTFLALTKLRSGQPTSSPAQGTTSGGVSAVRSVLPGLPRQDDEQILRQAGPGRREFGSALEALIPDPAVYKFETGTGYEIRPVIQPDGQAVVFHFNYMYTTNVREPVRPDEKHLGRVKRQFIDDEVQLTNYELREVSTYRVALKAARTSRGVPLFEDLPGVGVLFRPLPSAESSLQENIILAQGTIFPTLFDLMGLRWAPAVADLDTLGLRNADFVVRGRGRDLENHVFDIATTKVDDSLRIPPAERRTDLYRDQETISDVHPDGYRGPGLNLRDSTLREGYDVESLYPSTRYTPPTSREVDELPTRRKRIDDGGEIIEGEVIEGEVIEDVGPPTYSLPDGVSPVAPGPVDANPILEPLPQSNRPARGRSPNMVPSLSGGVPPLNGPRESAPPIQSHGFPTGSGTRTGRGIEESRVRPPAGAIRPSASLPARSPATPRTTTGSVTALPPLPGSTVAAPVRRDPGLNRTSAAKASPAPRPVAPPEATAPAPRKGILSRLRGRGSEG